ncbi:ketosamine-3-kinase-like [Littorina saxatilis]|uniref:protein-ribulosamine 3-kinase n=1 Tax=Littorina saxatilis TaxID=31220 RepID=A0AAN9GGD2_9CAEN
MPRTKGADPELEDLLKRELNTSVLKSEGRSGGGCISEGSTYSTDSGKVFIKVNPKSKAKVMFDGEAASLEKLYEMDVVKVPKPIKVITIPSGGAAFVMENLDITASLSAQAATLGEQMARLHMRNKEIADKEKKGESFVHKDSVVQSVKQFGFDVPTCCGYIQQSNAWESTWEKFYAGKIQEQIDMLPAEDITAVNELWSQVVQKLPSFFTGLDIFPALMHGDLWGGNAAEVADGPVVFDPASFYGHSEYDLAIARMFGGFSGKFFDSYFRIIPKEKGLGNRLELYKLFHYMNHWNHFGGGYKQSSLNTLRSLIQMHIH